jgi:hypothetical protein
MPPVRNRKAIRPTTMSGCCFYQQVSNEKGNHHAHHDDPTDQPGFFLVLFVWFCITTTPGTAWWQLRGWPVNWLLQLDPLVGLSVVLATHTLYAGLLWGAVTLVLTLFLGRFFCSWICPMGTLQQVTGYVGMRSLTPAQRIRRNQPHRAQALKYGLLLFLLAAACAELLSWLLSGNTAMLVAAGAMAGAIIVFRMRRQRRTEKKSPWNATPVFLVCLALLAGFHWWTGGLPWIAATLQTGPAGSVAVCLPGHQPGIAALGRCTPAPDLLGSPLLCRCRGRRPAVVGGAHAMPSFSPLLLSFCLPARRPAGMVLPLGPLAHTARGGGVPGLPAMRNPL